MARLKLSDCANDVCPWSGRPVSADALTLYRGQVVGFADRTARDRFLQAVLLFDTAIAPPPVPALCRPAAVLPAAL